MTKAIFALIASALLASCANGLPGFRPLTYQESAETRVFASAENCPHLSGSNFSPVVAAFAVQAASQLLQGFGTALTNAAQGGALPSSIATSNLEVTQRTLPHCIIIVRGEFQDPDSETPGVDLGIPEAYRSNLMAGAGFPVVSRLYHYVELQVIASSDKSALSVAPVFVRIDRSMDGSTSGTRELSIAVSFSKLSGNPTGSAVLLGGQRVGEWNIYAADARGRLPYEAPWFASFVTEANESPIPITLKTTVIETRPTRQFLAFAGAVFGGARATLQQAITNEIDPAAAQVVTNAEVTAETAFNTAHALASSTLITYCALSTEPAARAQRITESAKVRNAQIESNRQAQILGIMDRRFGTLVNVSGEPPAFANPQLCMPG